VRSNYNRQARRAGLCIRARPPRGRERAISPGRVALTAYGSGLAEFAAYIADGLELPTELVELLSPACLPTSAGLGPRREPSPHGRMLELAAQTLNRGVPEH
jgi:hypothetical protein